VLGRRPAEACDPDCDPEHADDLAPTDALSEPAGADREQEDEPERERRLDDRQRREPDRDRLQRPAAEVEPDAEQPARSPDEPAEERQTKPVLPSDRACFQRLQRDPGAVERGRAGRRGESEEEPPLAHRTSHYAAMGPRAVLAAGGIAFLYLAPSISAGVRPLRPLLGVRDRTGSGDGVALTFDDGPHPVATPAVLQLLAREGVTATFFLVGEQVERRPSLAAEIAAAGHEVATHCYRHRSLLRLLPGQVRDDLMRAEDAIASATGQVPRLYRPPYGVLNGAALAHARRRGWATVLWTREGHDWEGKATAASIADRVTRLVGDGDVLLLHDADFYAASGSWRNTLSALPLVLEELARRGLRTTRI